MSYPTDNGRLTFFLFVTAVLVIFLLTKRKEFRSAPYKTGWILLSMGTVELLIAIAGVCSTEGHWDSDIILAFLGFKIVSPKLGLGGLYYLRAMGYSFFLLGVTTLLFGSQSRSGKIQ